MKHEASGPGAGAETPANAAGGSWRHRLQRWSQRAGALGLELSFKRPPARPAPDPAEVSTLLPPSRGQALREAHRTLRQRMRSHPAMRQVVPHLSHIERALAKRGSIALVRLPMPVLQRGLQQLAVLQHDDDAPRDAMNLRVLRLRLIEAIAARSTAAPAPATARWANSSHGTGFSPTLGVVQSSLPPFTTLPGMEVSELPASAFDDADPANAWTAAAAQRMPPRPRR